MKIGIVVTICIALFTVAIMTPTAFSRDEHAHGKDKEFHHKSKMQMKSKKEMFSKEQLQQFESLKVDNAKKLIPLKAQIEVIRLELKQLWGADELNEAAIVSKSEEMLAVKMQIQQAMTRHKLVIAKLLTKEQREAWMKKHAFGDGDKKKGRKYRGKSRGRRHHRAWGKDCEMRDRDHDEEWEEKREMRRHRREKREEAREMRRHGRHEHGRHKHSDKDWDEDEEKEDDEGDSDEERSHDE